MLVDPPGRELTNVFRLMLSLRFRSKVCGGRLPSKVLILQQDVGIPLMGADRFKATSARIFCRWTARIGHMFAKPGPGGCLCGGGTLGHGMGCDVCYVFIISFLRGLVVRRYLSWTSVFSACAYVLVCFAPGCCVSTREGGVGGVRARFAWVPSRRSVCILCILATLFLMKLL